MIGWYHVEALVQDFWKNDTTFGILVWRRLVQAADRCAALGSSYVGLHLLLEVYGHDAIDATKATDWTAAFMLRVEVHIVVASTAAEQGRWEGKLDVLYSCEVSFKQGSEKTSHESKPWKIPTSKLQCFELPFNNERGWQKNRPFKTYYPLGYECSKL